MAATLLASSACKITQVPKLMDTATMLVLLKSLGAQTAGIKDNCVLINPQTVNQFKAPYDLVKTMRASILVLGPLLSKFGHAEVSFPGGCAIGSRPVDLHLRVLVEMGAKIEILGGYIVASAPQGLSAVDFYFEVPTVGGTENAVMAAVMAKGKTILRNAAREPEIIDLIRFLRSMGAQIEGEGSDTLMINGVKKLLGCDYQVMPDRIEAGTYLVAAIATRGQITLKGVSPETLGVVLEKLREAGANIAVGGTWVSADMAGRRPNAVDIRTAPFPGFPTDMQAQFVALNAVAMGRSEILETVFENRLMQAHEMNRMGADIAIDGGIAVVHGRPGLQGARVMASDLRASASLVIAGLVASGETIIDRIYHIDRGYEHIEAKLQSLGADIHRIPMNAT